MKRLQNELLRLKDQGERSLASEIESLLETTAGSKQTTATKEEIPLSLKFLALAAAEIDKGNFSFAHDCVGSAIEAHQLEAAGEPIELNAAFQSRLSSVEVTASHNAMLFPVPEVGDDEPTFEESSPETIASFSDLLVNAGYAKQAKDYVQAFNQKTVETTAKGEESMSIDKKKALQDLRDGFKKSGNLAMVKAADEMLEELGEEEPKVRSAAMVAEAEGCGCDKTKDTMMKAGYMMKAAEMMEQEGKDATAMKADAEKLYEEAKAMMKKPEETPPVAAATAAAPEKKKLYVEPESSKELRLKEVAARATAKGDAKKAREALAQVRSLERMRLVAALIKAGDTDLAMEGLKEEEAEGQGGYSMNAADHDENMEAKEDEEAAASDSEMPEGETATEEPSKEPEEPEQSEEDMAKELSEKVESSVKRKKMKEAVAAFGELTKLEEAIVAAVRKVRAAKDEALAKEGFKVWREVAKHRLHAEAVIAEEEGEDKVYDEAMEGMENLEDESKAAEELDKALEGADDATAEGDDMVVPPGGVGEGDEGKEEKKEEGEEGEKVEEPKALEESTETEAMHYEVLQSLEEVKAMKVDRNALAFTFWEDESGSNPFYVVQAAGKPIAEIHLGDQDNAKEIKAYFCDDQKYTKALAQSVENTNLYEMLKGVHARFYANAVDNSAFAEKMKQQAVASVADVRTEKLATLRKDFTEAMTVAANALNKGLYNKPNALKSAFAKVLSSYGIAQPHLAVEAAFNEAGSIFFDQVMEAANEYLEMPKEAFAHAKKMVDQASNVAHATASNFGDLSIGARLSQNSLPLGNVPETQEAPVVARTIHERAAVDDYKSKLKLGRKF